MTFLPHQILNGEILVGEKSQVIADDVAVLATGTGDEDGAVVVAVFGDGVGGARVAGFAGEC